MDTNVFRYVLEVDKCKNITLAAKHLFISQPALTKQLSKLEKELGFQLFDRAHTPITTTPQGELFLDFARRYQELEQDFQNDIALSRHTPAVPVRIATTHRGGGYAGIHTAAFMAAYPNICLEYLDTSARKCEELLEEEQVDLAIYTDPILSSKLEYMPLEEDPLVFVIPQSSPLLAGLDLSGNSLEHPVEIESRRFRDPSLRYILATPGQGLYYAENAFFKKYRVTPLDPLRVEYVDTRYSVVQSGCGIALFPHTTVIQHSHGNSQPPLYGIPKGDALYRLHHHCPEKGPHPLPRCRSRLAFYGEPAAGSQSPFGIHSITIPHCPNRADVFPARFVSFESVLAFSRDSKWLSAWRKRGIEEVLHNSFSTSYNAIVRFASK